MVEGKKDDTEKLRYDLIPPEATKALATILTYGARKYAPGNWMHVQPFVPRYTAALLRHLEAWRGGEKIDPRKRPPPS